MAAVIAAAAAAQQKYLRAFRKAGATDPQHARSLEELGLRENRIFRRLLNQGYLIAAGNGYYVDEDRVEQHRQRAITAILVLLVILAVILVAIAFAKGT